MSTFLTSHAFLMLPIDTVLILKLLILQYTTSVDVNGVCILFYYYLDILRYISLYWF